MQYQMYERDIVAKAKSNYIPGMDWQDIAQELRLHLWIKRDRYLPDKGASERTFAIRLLENKLKDLKKAAYREKRKIDSFHLTFSHLESTDEGQILLYLAQKIA